MCQECRTFSWFAKQNTGKVLYSILKLKVVSDFETTSYGNTKRERLMIQIDSGISLWFSSKAFIQEKNRKSEACRRDNYEPLYSPLFFTLVINSLSQAAYKSLERSLFKHRRLDVTLY